MSSTNSTPIASHRWATWKGLRTHSIKTFRATTILAIKRAIPWNLWTEINCYQPQTYKNGAHSIRIPRESNSTLPNQTQTLISWRDNQLCKHIRYAVPMVPESTPQTNGGELSVFSYDYTVILGIHLREWALHYHIIARKTLKPAWQVIFKCYERFVGASLWSMPIIRKL